MIPLRAITSAAIASRAAWETAGGAEPALELTDWFQDIWAEVSAYYTRDVAASSVNPETLRASLARRYTNPKHAKSVDELVTGLIESDVSTLNVTALLRQGLVDRTGLALAAALASRRPDEETGPLLDAYRSALDSGTETDNDTDGDVTWKEAIKSRINRLDRIQLTPRVLNERLGGGLLPGTSVVIFGRPESGKSALALTIACGCARRGVKVLYVGNEDPIQSLMVRAVANLSGKTIAEIEANPDEAELIAIKRGASNLVFKQLAPGTLFELDRACRAIKPRVLIVDQLRNLSAKGSENFVQNLDALARGIRAIGLRNGVATVAVTQAGDSASGKPILGMGDIDSSNTGIPGAADVLIGVGVTESLESAGVRKLSLPKNKLTGNHEPFEVRFNSALSKVES